MTTIRWTEQAVADLEAIRDDVARDSAKYATLLVERLIASLDRVSSAARPRRWCVSREATREMGDE